jgi:hypothetical protein
MADEPAAELLRVAAHAELERRRPSHDEKVSKGDPVASAALILSIPSAILAARDLVERARIAKRVRGLLQKVRKGDGTTALHVGDEPSLDLRTATEDEVMNLLAMRRP